jgi:hypothetical protein
MLEDDIYRDPPRSRPLRFTLSHLRLHRTVDGVTHTYRLVDSITVIQGHGPTTIPIKVEPTLWKFNNKHGEISLGSPGVSVVK